METGLNFIFFILTPVLTLVVAAGAYRYGSSSARIWGEDKPPKDACDKMARKIVGSVAFFGAALLAYPVIFFAASFIVVWFSAIFSATFGR